MAKEHENTSTTTLQDVLDQLDAAREGQLVALVALTKALRESPGFNVEALENWAQYFLDNPSTAATKSDDAMGAYQIVLQALKHRDINPGDGS